MQESIYNIKDTKKKKNCNCGVIPGKTQLLNNFAHIGVNTNFIDNGVFKNNSALCTENNYCPQCGKKYDYIVQ